MKSTNIKQLKVNLFFSRALANLFPRDSKPRKFFTNKKNTTRELLSKKQLQHSEFFKTNIVDHDLQTATNKLERSVKTLQSIALSIQDSKSVDQRLKDVTSSPDLSRIKRVPNAGKIVGNDQIMHNGLIVGLGSFYGEEFHQKVIYYGQGVHEPQEEYIYGEVLKHIKPGSCMLELGAYWGFYSMWFQKEIANAKTILVEPDMVNLQMGRLNYLLNGFKGHFLQGFLGDKPGGLNLLSAPVLTVDEIFKTEQISHLHMLHSDIQGAEYQMLLGAKNSFKNRLIDYCFISTHSNQVHDNCLKFLKDHNYFIISEYNLTESYSADGLIAARRKELEGIGEVKISKR